MDFMGALGHDAEGLVERGHVLHAARRHLQLVSHPFQGCHREPAVLALDIEEDLYQCPGIAPVLLDYPVNLLQFHSYPTTAKRFLSSSNAASRLFAAVCRCPVTSAGVRPRISAHSSTVGDFSFSRVRTSCIWSSLTIVSLRMPSTSGLAKNRSYSSRVSKRTLSRSLSTSLR